jgi:hypothetical protein
LVDPQAQALAVSAPHDKRFSLGFLDGSTVKAFRPVVGGGWNPRRMAAPKALYAKRQIRSRRRVALGAIEPIAISSPLIVGYVQRAMTERANR